MQELVHELVDEVVEMQRRGAAFLTASQTIGAQQDLTAVQTLRFSAGQRSVGVGHRSFDSIDWPFDVNRPPTAARSAGFIFRASSTAPIQSFRMDTRSR